ncbi:MAG: polysaccharide biosynthesis/export family protein, partial [Acidobacteria bacterium]|nr:polysaccharide biosynthesis/export family protein [Acidobacteriota bacterium]
MTTPLPLALVLAFVTAAALSAQAPRPAPPQPAPQTRPAAPVPASPAPAVPPGQAVPAGVTPPSDYTIGADDVLEVIVWREKDLSAEVKVRPDGKVSLPLVNDIQAGGLTPEAFRTAVTTAVTKFVEAPSVTVIVKQINSRQVFVMGEVVKPGTYPLTAPTTVLQLLAQAGCPSPDAKVDEIGVMRTVDGKTT